MNRVLLLLVSISIFGLNNKQNQNETGLADLNIIIKTDKIVDSVWVSDIGQIERFYLPFNDTIKINFKRELNDLYNINFYTSEGRLSNQLWLNGKKVTLNGQLNDKLEIDFITNSDLYYTAVNFFRKYRELIQENSDSLVIDNFLISHLKENVENPFSFAIANPYIQRNQNNKNKIRVLFELLKNQNETLQNHFISNHKTIENILKVDFLDFANFKFSDTENNITSIKLEKSKQYLLDFWSINCPPCIRDHKIILEKLDFLNEKNIEVIGISTDRNFLEWKDYITNNRYNWKNFRELDSLKRLTNELDVLAFPTYILVGGNGKINARFNSYVDYEKYIKK